jgi:hypothetical protein
VQTRWPPANDFLETAWEEIPMTFVLMKMRSAPPFSPPAASVPLAVPSSLRSSS